MSLFQIERDSECPAQMDENEPDHATSGPPRMMTRSHKVSDRKLILYKSPSLKIVSDFNVILIARN